MEADVRGAAVTEHNYNGCILIITETKFYVNNSKQNKQKKKLFQLLKILLEPKVIV